MAMPLHPFPSARWWTKKSPALLLAAGLLLLPLPANAAEVPPALQRCVGERDDRLRLACFDREMAQFAGSNGSAAADGAERRFGFRGEVARETLDRERREAPTLDKLASAVTEVRTQPTGYWVVTLENGQQWSQVPLGRKLSIRAGDAVTIVPLSLGSFMLVAPSGESTRVRRRR